MQDTIALALGSAKVFSGAAEAVLAAAGIEGTGFPRSLGILATFGVGIALTLTASATVSRTIATITTAPAASTIPARI